MQLDKQLLRQRWGQRRREISTARREEAEASLVKASRGWEKVLSYASFGSELNTWPLNICLARQGQLYLPKVIEDGSMAIYKVEKLNEQLQKGALGILEPVGDKCLKVENQEDFFILVPGLAFDRHCHRLGYGKGYYDRFLASLCRKSTAWGVGFREQFSQEPLPINERDIKLSNVLFF